MSIRPRCAALMLMLCLGLSGCSPTPETQLDEQKNPYYLAGKEKLGALDYKGAVESFERAVEDNPRSALAHFELGVLFDQHENDYASALYHYNKALKLRPSGYPAENIRPRIQACKQELVKADSLTTINPGALRETENLRVENAALRKRIELLQAHLASRPPAVPAAAAPIGQAFGARDNSYPAPVVQSSGSNAYTRTDNPSASRAPFTTTAPDRSRSLTGSASRMRTHSVKAGETATSIARQYSIKVSSLLSANPSLEPKRMRIGQMLNIPSS